MKTQVSSLELSYLVRELDELVDCRVNKVFQKEDGFLFDLHKPGEGRIMFRALIPNAVFFTQYKPDFPSHPPKFCMFLRKHLGGMIVDEVRQKGFDRILEIEFSGFGEKYILVLELFSKGNLILCKEDYEIVAPFNSQTWQSRTIRGGTGYEYPPDQLNPYELDFDSFWQVFEDSDMDEVVKTLAVDFGLGGAYAEEVCARAGIDKSLSSEDLVEEKARSLFEGLDEVLNSEVEATAVGDRVYPFDPVSVEGERKYFDSFNEAVDEVVSRNLVARKEEEKEEIRQERIDKVENIIRDQEESIKKLKGDIRDNKRKGELVFENYQRLSDLLYQVNQAREDGLSWDEIREKLEEVDWVEQVNDKEKLLVVDL